MTTHARKPDTRLDLLLAWYSHARTSTAGRWIAKRPLLVAGVSAALIVVCLPKPEIAAAVALLLAVGSLAIGWLISRLDPSANCDAVIARALGRESGEDGES